MVYYVLAGDVDGSDDFSLDESKIAVNGFLEYSALGLDVAIHGVLLDDGIDLLFVEEDSSAHVVMVLLDAGLAAAGFLPCAAVSCAEMCYFLCVLALVHMNDYLI